MKWQLRNCQRYAHRRVSAANKAFLTTRNERPASPRSVPFLWKSNWSMKNGYGRVKDRTLRETVDVHARGNGLPARPVYWKIPLWVGFQKVLSPKSKCFRAFCGSPVDETCPPRYFTVFAISLAKPRWRLIVPSETQPIRKVEVTAAVGFSWPLSWWTNAPTGLRCFFQKRSFYSSTFSSRFDSLRPIPSRFVTLTRYKYGAVYLWHKAVIPSSIRVTSFA